MFGRLRKYLVFVLTVGMMASMTSGVSAGEVVESVGNEQVLGTLSDALDEGDEQPPGAQGDSLAENGYQLKDESEEASTGEDNPGYQLDVTKDEIQTNAQNLKNYIDANGRTGSNYNGNKYITTKRVRSSNASSEDVTDIVQSGTTFIEFVCTMRPENESLKDFKWEIHIPYRIQKDANGENYLASEVRFSLIKELIGQADTTLAHFSATFDMTNYTPNTELKFIRTEVGRADEVDNLLELIISTSNTLTAEAVRHFDDYLNEIIGTNLDGLGFRSSLCRITYAANEGGKIAPAPNQKNVTSTESGWAYVNRGSSFKAEITPDQNYYIKDVKVDGESKGDESTITLTNLQTNHTIEAEFVHDFCSPENGVIDGKQERLALVTKAKYTLSLGGGMATSSDPKVAKVNKNGTIQAKKPGVATLSVTDPTGKITTLSIIVEKPKMKKANGVPGQIGTPVTLGLLQGVQYALPQRLESSNPTVATISDNNIIVVKGPGKSKITAYYGTKKFKGQLKV